MTCSVSITKDQRHHSYALAFRGLPPSADDDASILVKVDSALARALTAMMLPAQE